MDTLWDALNNDPAATINAWFDHANDLMINDPSTYLQTIECFGTHYLLHESTIEKNIHALRVFAVIFAGEPSVSNEYAHVCYLIKHHLIA